MTPPQTIAAIRPSAPTIEEVLSHRWARWLVPSFSDLFFLAVIAWLFMGVYGWSGLLGDADVGWHIRTGEYILNHHAVPYHDLYSFSKPGAPWYAWEWLSDVLSACLFRLAGLKGIVLTAGVVIALFATTLVRRMIWRGVHLLVAKVVALLGVGSSTIHFLARPHIYTLLLLSISIWIIEADRRRETSKIWWLVPLTLVWTNLHGGFLVLVAALGVATLGEAVEALLLRDWRRPIRYALLTAACAAVSLVNPYGYGLHRHVIEYLRSDWIRNAVQEFQSPSFRTESMMQFEALLFLGLMTAAALLRRKQVVEGLWILFFAYLSLSAVRHVPVFVTVTAPLIAAEIAGWWTALTGQASRKSLATILNQMADDCAAGFRRSSAWPALAVLALALTGAPIHWPKDFPSELFPVEMIHAHEAEILGSRVFTTDQWADYLIYLHPEQKVFVDGRSDFYGPEIGNRYLGALNGTPEWQKVMEKYSFNVALLPVENALSQLLKQRPEWRVVADNGKQIFLVLRSTSVPPTQNLSPEPRF
jgi:hypothetical protein